MYNSALNPKNYTSTQTRKFIFPILLLIIEINHFAIEIWNNCNITLSYYIKLF